MSEGMTGEALPRIEPECKLVTLGALALLNRAGETPEPYFARHLSGDWGELGEEDRRRNEQAARDGGWVVSVYRTTMGEEVWVATCPDRSESRLCTPEEF